MSYGRIAARRTRATSQSARSPTWWPWLSLMSLKLSRSMTISETSDFSRSARASSRDPSGETLAGVHGDLLDDLGVGSRREPAAQRLGLLIVQEERRARERHQVAQLRGNQRHRVRHAEARAHRLRDLVERVDLAV